jgi:hypothetical protein
MCVELLQALNTAVHAIDLDLAQKRRDILCHDIGLFVGRDFRFGSFSTEGSRGRPAHVLAQCLRKLT